MPKEIRLEDIPDGSDGAEVIKKVTEIARRLASGDIPGESFDVPLEDAEQTETQQVPGDL